MQIRLFPKLILKNYKFRKFNVPNKGPFVSTDRRKEGDNCNIPIVFLKTWG